MCTGHQLSFSLRRVMLLTIGAVFVVIFNNEVALRYLLDLIIFYLVFMLFDLFLIYFAFFFF